MKILLIQHRQIGDVLMCTPALRELRKNFIGAEITFMVENFSSCALMHNRNIDKFIIPSRKMSPAEYVQLIMRLKKEKFDIVIDFFQNPKSAAITWFSRANKRISFKRKWRNWPYTITVDPGHDDQYAAKQKLRLLKPLEIKTSDDYLLDLYVPDEDRKWADALFNRLGFKSDDLILALSPVSRRAYKVWPGEYFAQLCNHLIKKYSAKILFTWGPGEKSFINEIVCKMDKKPDCNYSISTIQQLKALFEKSSLFIGNDNGPRHIAISGDIPTVGLFGTTNPLRWTPPNAPMHTIIHEKGKGIKDIRLEYVIKTIDTKLESLLSSQ